MIYGQAITFGGGGKSPIPEFTYTGDWEAIQEDEVNWKIRLLSSGQLTFKKAQTVDAFLVGGGGGGGGGGGQNETAGSDGGSGGGGAGEYYSKDTGYTSGGAGEEGQGSGGGRGYHINKKADVSTGGGGGGGSYSGGGYRRVKEKETEKATITFQEWWSGEKSLTSTAARRASA